MQEKIENLLIELIRIPSVSSDIDELHRIVAFVESYFQNTPNAYIKTYEFNKKPSIVIQNFKWNDPDILFNGHLDVVPPSEEDQFTPKKVDNKLYARGAWDMKAWVAILMTLFQEILTTNITDKKLSLLLTTDEEIGGFDGAEIFAVQNIIQPKCVIIPDSGTLHDITIAEKWVIQLKVKVHGKSSHASRVWLWDSAVDKALKLYQEFRDTFQEPALFEEPKHWGSSVNMTIFNAWSACNVIPEEAFVWFDIRVTETFPDMDKNLQTIQSILQKYDATLESSLLWDLLYTDADHPFIVQYAQSVEKITNSKPHKIYEHGGSDGRFFSSKGIPVLLHRPTCHNIHAKWEYVELDTLVPVYESFKHFVMQK